MQCCTFTDFYLKHGRERLDAILFDVDGTLSSGGKPLPGAKELLELLEKEKFPYLLLTNDSCNSRAEKAGILRRGGLPVTENSIYSCGNVLKAWKEESGYNGELFFRCGRLGDPDYSELAGINTTSDPDRIMECRGVIIGEGRYSWQENLEAVFNLFLVHPEYPMLVPNPDSYWPHCDAAGMGIGSGAQARFICTVLHDAGKEVLPTYLGKPHPPIYRGLNRELNALLGRQVPPERIAMVGDSLASDIMGANANGLLSCLVLTGITTMELAAQAAPERKPAMIFRAV